MYVGGKYSSLIVETFNVIVTVTIRPSSFFFRLALSAFPDIGSVGRVEEKNKREDPEKKGGLVP